MKKTMYFVHVLNKFFSISVSVSVNYVTVTTHWIQSAHWKQCYRLTTLGIMFKCTALKCIFFFCMERAGLSVNREPWKEVYNKVFILKEKPDCPVYIYKKILKNDFCSVCMQNSLYVI